MIMHVACHFLEKNTVVTRFLLKFLKNKSVGIYGNGLYNDVIQTSFSKDKSQIKSDFDPYRERLLSTMPMASTHY